MRGLCDQDTCRNHAEVYAIDHDGHAGRFCHACAEQEGFQKMHEVNYRGYLMARLEKSIREHRKNQ